MHNFTNNADWLMAMDFHTRLIPPVLDHYLKMNAALPH